MTADALLAWFRSHRRELPWRREPRDPYRVLVSELMLQQTQVARVVPAYEAFIARFPDLAALAAASEEEVVAAWSGLGYYRRARLVARLAREVTAAGGELPSSAAALEQLPGVGGYTAAAVASLAFGEAIPVLDGNVLRVGARVLGLDSDPRAAAGRKALLEWARDLMQGRSPGAVNEALMELGAVVCRPEAPECTTCPLADACVARASGRQEAIPVPRRVRAAVALRWVAAVVVGPDGRWLLRRVEEGPILRGLWLPPVAELVAGGDPEPAARVLVPHAGNATARVLPEVRHSITHRRITVVPVRLAVDGGPAPPGSWRWENPGRCSLPTSSLLAKLVRVEK